LNLTFGATQHSGRRRLRREKSARLEGVRGGGSDYGQVERAQDGVYVSGCHVDDNHKF
jgi:hypothetical protein